MRTETVQALTERMRQSTHLAKAYILRRKVHEARMVAMESAHYGIQITRKPGDGSHPCIKCMETVQA